MATADEMALNKPSIVCLPGYDEFEIHCKVQICLVCLLAPKHQECH